MQPSGLPLTLEQAIANAQLRLRAYHDLDAEHRQAIYAGLGPWGENSVESPGYRRRAWLALHSVWRVLPLLERHLPNSRSRDMLCLAEQVLAGKQNRLQTKIEYLLHALDWEDADPQAFKALIRVHQPFGNLSVEDVIATIEQVAIAAQRALGVALMDEYNTPQLLKAHPEKHPAYWSSDAASWAWVAYREKDGMAQGAQAIRNGDEFWHWWLAALPFAWYSA